MLQWHSSNADLPGLCWLTLTPHWATSRLWDMDEDFSLLEYEIHMPQSLRRASVLSSLGRGASFLQTDIQQDRKTWW